MGWLRQTFNNWLSAILGNCLILLFVATFSKVGFSIGEYVISMEKNASSVFTIPIGMAIEAITTTFGVKKGYDMGVSIASIVVDTATKYSSTYSLRRSAKKVLSDMYQGKR